MKEYFQSGCGINTFCMGFVMTIALLNSNAIRDLKSETKDLRAELAQTQGLIEFNRSECSCKCCEKPSKVTTDTTRGQGLYAEAE